MLQIPKQLERAMAKSIGYTGDMAGFQSYVQSNPQASKTFEGMLSILDTQNKEMSSRRNARSGVLKMQTGGLSGSTPQPIPGTGGQIFPIAGQNPGGPFGTIIGAQPSSGQGTQGTQSASGQALGPFGQQLPKGLLPYNQLSQAGQQAVNSSIYSAVQPQPGFTFAFDSQGNRFQVPANYYQTATTGTQQAPSRFPVLPTAPAPGQQSTAGKSIGEVSADMMSQPGLPSGAEIQVVGVAPTADQDIAQQTGQLTGQVAIPTAQAGTATTGVVQASQANVMQAAQAAPAVDAALNATQAAQTNPNDPNAQITAAQQTASSVGNLQAAQGNAQLINNPVQRQIQAGELISGSGVDATKASQSIAQTQAATATPSVQATVQGQLADLAQQFQGANPPAWAAGAIRLANSQMAARGLGASSLAGQAIVQAAMEASLPIAQADAQIQARFEGQNLSNRQQVAMLAAEQRARFLGQEFDQEFQARVQNAARVADIAGQNFNAEQQVQLENSRAINTMNLNNLSNRQALVIAQASALANLDLSNLGNRQQAAVQNAKSFLQMDMANLSNQQQANMFNAQQRIQSLFTDNAAENAARQFNATSQNQVDQFFASLAQQASQFNSTQINAQEQFNAGQRNTIERFNAEMNNNRDQFNAQNQMVIAQSNANWRRQIATADTAAINRANEINAQALLGISNQAYNNLWNYYGDTMEWAWTSAENERSRVIELARAQLAADSDANIQNMKNDYQSSAAFGKIIGSFITGGFGGGFF